MNSFARLVRATTLKIDQRLGTRLKPSLGDRYRQMLRGWSGIRRIIDPLLIRARYELTPGKVKPVKLHLGCGPKHFDDYTNVDLWITEATDVICHIGKLPWPDESVLVIETHHVIEHISHRKIEDTLREWHRVLLPGGQLIIETPHFDLTLREYLAGKEERLLSIFGRQRREGDAHFYGYNPDRLATLLKSIGFSDFVQTQPQSHQAAEEPVFRMECRKSRGSEALTT